MKKILITSTLAALTCVASRADLIGTSVTGSLKFTPNPVNYFEGLFGFVPAGYGNSGIGHTTVTISSGTTEFGFSDGANTDTVDFTGTTLTLKDVSNFGSTGFQIKLTDTAFAGLTLTEVSDSFLSGGANAALSGNTITIDVPAFATRSTTTFTAKYSFGTTVRVPDGGATVAMMGVGLLGLAALRSRKSI